MHLESAIKRLAKHASLYKFVCDEESGPSTRPYQTRQPDGNLWTEGLVSGHAIPLTLEEALALNRGDFALYVEYREGMSTGRGRAVKPTHTWVGWVSDQIQIIESGDM